MAEELLYICKVPNELADISSDILNKFPDSRVFAFRGNMGAGKTTMIKEFCKLLGVNDSTSSPSFSIVNEYITEDGENIYHFDFYRINKKEEVFDIGYEEYFYSDNYCFIEWPEKIEELLPEKFVYVVIEVESTGTRYIKVNFSGGSA